MNLFSRRHALGLVVALLSSCNDKIPAPTLHTDPAGLRNILDLPYGSGPVRWVEILRVPQGCGWVPGPTDRMYVACVTLDGGGWATLQSKTGPSTSRDQLRIVEDVAEMIFDTTQLAKLPRDGDVRLVEGPKWNLHAVGMYPASGVRLGDTLVVSLLNP